MARTLAEDMMGLGMPAALAQFIYVNFLPRSTMASYTDKSGTVALGGVAQVLSAANPNRLGFWIQNQSSGDLWFTSIGTATPVEPSTWLPPGSYYEFPESGVPTTALSIFGDTTGQQFAAREW